MRQLVVLKPRDGISRSDLRARRSPSPSSTSRAGRRAALCRVFIAFAVFVIADGATHLAAVWALWQPSAWLTTVLKLTTALASVAVALLLPPLVPKALGLGAAGALLDSAPDAIILVDAAGVIRLVNERAERLFGYARRELLGQAIDAGAAGRRPRRARRAAQRLRPAARRQPLPRRDQA